MRELIDRLGELTEASEKKAKFNVNEVARKLKWKDKAKVGTLGKPLSTARVELFDVAVHGAYKDWTESETWGIELSHGWGSHSPNLITITFYGKSHDDPADYFRLKKDPKDLDDAKKIVAQMLVNYMQEKKASGYKAL